MNVAMLTERRKKPTVVGGKRRKNTTTKIDVEEKVHSSKMTSMNVLRPRAVALLSNNLNNKEYCKIITFL